MNLPWAIDCQMLESISNPEEGAILSLNHRKYSSSCPSQNTGMETPISANSMPARSQNDPRLMPETMPMGMPMKSHRIAAPIASVIVTGSRRKISSLTGTKLLYE